MAWHGMAWPLLSRNEILPPQQGISLFAGEKAAQLKRTAKAQKTNKKVTIAHGYVVKYYIVQVCVFCWMTTRSTQCLATASINHFPCHVIALLCLPCEAAYQNQTGVAMARIMLMVASKLAYCLQIGLNVYERRQGLLTCGSVACVPEQYSKLLGIVQTKSKKQSM